MLALPIIGSTSLLRATSPTDGRASVQWPCVGSVGDFRVAAGGAAEVGGVQDALRVAELGRDNRKDHDDAQRDHQAIRAAAVVEDVAVHQVLVLHLGFLPSPQQQHEQVPLQQPSQQDIFFVYCLVSIGGGDVV
jgi:hypothetical protein